MDKIYIETAHRATQISGKSKLLLPRSSAFQNPVVEKAHRANGVTFEIIPADESGRSPCYKNIIHTRKPHFRQNFPSEGAHSSFAAISDNGAAYFPGSRETSPKRIRF
jgi:hypothetical protein